MYSLCLALSPSSYQNLYTSYKAKEYYFQEVSFEILNFLWTRWITVRYTSYLTSLQGCRVLCCSLEEHVKIDQNHCAWNICIMGCCLHFINPMRGEELPCLISWKFLWNLIFIFPSLSCQYCGDDDITQRVTPDSFSPSLWYLSSFVLFVSWWGPSPDLHLQHCRARPAGRLQANYPGQYSSHYRQHRPR